MLSALVSLGSMEVADHHPKEVFGPLLVAVVPAAPSLVGVGNPVLVGEEGVDFPPDPFLVDGFR